MALEPSVPHAYKRWALAVVGATQSPTDPRTLTDWGHMIGSSTSRLRETCYLAGVQPRRALDFTRVLRLVLFSLRMSSWDPANVLDVADQRSIGALLRRGNAEFLKSSRLFSVEDFLNRQCFVTDTAILVVLAIQLTHFESLDTPVTVADARSKSRLPRDGLR